MTGIATPEQGVGSKVKAYVEMTKPRIIELLLITTIPAMVVAEQGWPGWKLVLLVLVGGTLSAGGANVLNQVYDSDVDRIMKRTSGRPIPTNRAAPIGATVFGLLLGLGGFVVLTVGSTLLAGVLSLVAFAYYVLVYTMFLKRSTTQNIVIGGAAGAVPALIGWAAVTGELSVAPWVMFAIIFYWTPPHFWALSIKYEEDYRRAGIPMLSVIAGDEVTFSEILWYSVVTVGVSLMLIPVAHLGWIYGAAVVVLGLWLVFGAYRLGSDRTKAMPFFGFTNVYLAGVFLVMMVDRLVEVPSLGGEQFWMVTATTLIGVGGLAVIRSEVMSHARGPGVSRLRQIVEVGMTAVFAFALTWQAWLVIA